MAIARGAGASCSRRGGLARNPEALRAASDFADNVNRNAALFAPFKPRATAGEVRVDGGRPRSRRESWSRLTRSSLIAINARVRARVTWRSRPRFPKRSGRTWRTAVR